MSESKPAVLEAVIEDVSKFEPSALKHVECPEKKILPTVEGNLFKLLIFFLLVQ